MWKELFPAKRIASLAAGAAVVAALAGSVVTQSSVFGHRTLVVFSNKVELPFATRADDRDLTWRQVARSLAALPFAAEVLNPSLAVVPRGHSLAWLHAGMPQVGIPQTTVPSPTPLPDPSLAAGTGGDGAAKVRTVAVNDTAELSSAFRNMGYRLDDGESEAGAVEVPRLIVTEFPKDMAELDEPDFRKTLFFEVMLPLVLQANEVILAERDRLIAIRARIENGEIMSDEERGWLDGVESYYGVANDDFNELLARVDAVPPSLALAQAAIESGWGTSHYALEANALFGQYTTDADLGPVSGPASKNSDYRIHAFGGLFEAVVSYARNLNTHPAYQRFRRLRAEERKAGDTPDGLALANTLQRYSSRGTDYIHDVRAVIRANELDFLDDASLKDSEVTRVVLGNT
jgi:Bax protein